MDISQVDDRDSSYLKKLVNFLEEDCKVHDPIYFDEKKAPQFRSLDGDERNIICEKLNFKELFPKMHDLKYKDYVWKEFFNIYVYIKVEFSGNTSY